MRDDAESELVVELQPGLDGVPAAAWDALAGEDNPFLEHAFLHLLETSGSVGPGTGWQPLHVLVVERGRLIGAAPTYVKTDSFGEYIFDWGWAEAAARVGLEYYPKIVVGVPFTPATGPRLLVHPEASQQAVRAALVEGLEAARDTAGATGIHVLFSRDEETAALAEAGFSRRATHQYHWHNRGYASFDDFLAALRAPARKQIRRERRRVAQSAFEIDRVRGDELDAAGWARIYELYMATGARKWGRPYLTREFFELAGPTVGRRAVILRARRHRKVVAMTLSFEKGAHLYGRYWGADRHVDSLHFELCYYRLIEHAIASGKSLFEAGAQGEHKIKRGLVPVITHSAHRLAHPGLHRAVSQALRQERLEVGLLLEALASHAPFRSEGGPPGR